MTANSLPWYYLPQLGEPGTTAWLEGDEWHHLAHVMRMKDGDAVFLFDGKGKGMTGIIVSSQRSGGRIELQQEYPEQHGGTHPLHLSIAIAPTKQLDRTEFALEKLVEIGIDELILLDCEHNERTHLRLDRLEKIAISAAKQSRKLTLPVLIDFQKPKDCASQWMSGHPQGVPYFGHLDQNSVSIFANYSHPSDVLCMIGPEGGFSTAEVEELNAAGVVPIALGPHRLRTETAAISACAQFHLLHEMNTRP